MKNKTKANVFGEKQLRQIKKLVVKPLADLIKKQTLPLSKWKKKYSKKINNIDFLIGMIARQIARQLIEQAKHKSLF